MTYTTGTSAFTLFPAATASPNAFSIFVATQSPRDTHIMHEDMRNLLRPSSTQNVRRVSASSQKTRGLKKFFGM